MSFFIGENGSPNIPLIVAGIALIAFIAWKFFFSNSLPAGFGLKYSNLPLISQGTLALLFQGLGTGGAIGCLGTYNGTQTEFSITHIPSGTDYQGLLLASADGMINIYMNYYEYLNWAYAGTTSVLSLPMRTLTNGVVSDMPNGGFTMQGYISSATITYVNHVVTAGLVDSKHITLPISTLPTPI